VELMDLSYFSGRWGQSMHGQITMRRCGASAIHSLVTSRELRVCLACALEVVVPLTMALNGDAAILAQAMTLEFGPEVGHSDTHRRHMRH
jgi:hypothetical protein